jgi:hypothetical protein
VPIRGLRRGRHLDEEAICARRFTFDPADDRFTIWSPDGVPVMFLYSNGQTNGEPMLPPLTGARKVSSGGSTSPRRRVDGKELSTSRRIQS